MAAVHAFLTAFDFTMEEWTERLEFYFATNGITDGVKQRAVATSELCEPSTFQLLTSLVLLTPLTEFSFNELVAKMKTH